MVKKKRSAATALFMLGGQECYRSGGYDNTPIGRMLPVYLDRVSESAPIEDVRFNLTREGWLEPWTRLRVQQEADETRLSRMPAFFSVNQAFSIKPGASILATVSDAEQKAHPALVVQRFGEGRVAALLLCAVKYPLLTLRVIFLIHWHALRLWLKRVPFFSKPPAPAEDTTR